MCQLGSLLLDIGSLCCASVLPSFSLLSLTSIGSSGVIASHVSPTQALRNNRRGLFNQHHYTCTLFLQKRPILHPVPSNMALPNACLRLFLLLLTFLKLVAGCPPPYNDFDFLGNETHTTADLVRIAVDSSPYSPETAWVEVVTSVRHASR